MPKRSQPTNVQKKASAGQKSDIKTSVSSKTPKEIPPQHQEKHPGSEEAMVPRPSSEDPNYNACGKLTGKRAVITGGDSGIGRAISIAYAKEGADIAIIYHDQHKDAQDTQKMIEKQGRTCILIAGDISSEEFCMNAIMQIVKRFEKIDILVNNAAVQYVQESITDISKEQLEKTFATNIFSMFYMTKAVLKYMQKGGTIINTTSITAYKGNPKLIDYSSTKGAIVAFTRSLSQALVEKEIRVNAVAPGPVWTPLIPSSFPAEKVADFGKDVPMERPGQPFEIAPSYVFLASDDSSYITGQVLHPNGGVVVNG